jgi:uncharacterized membrane protein
VGLVALATVTGLVVLWPDDAEWELSPGVTSETERAEVISVTESPCPPPQAGTCVSSRVRLESDHGTDAVTRLNLGSTDLGPPIEVGDSIRVSAATPPPPGTTGAPGPGVAPAYNFFDFERRGPILWLALGFAALVVVFGRLRGALSLLGLVLSLAVVVLFVVPAILDGSSPLAVAIIGSLAVMLLTISLAHGLGPKSLAAIAGTSASLLLVALLAVTFTALTNLTGISAEGSTLLQFSGADLSLDGLLVAGMVIGALGVLDDVTVGQASTVLALRSANPALRFGALYRGALDVGRDHVSATVNTLVLAYAGASLPLLLILASGDLAVADAINVELVAKEVVAMLVGSIGLIAAVPITTAIAALLAPELVVGARPAEAHAHRVG